MLYACPPSCIFHCQNNVRVAAAELSSSSLMLISLTLACLVSAVPAALGSCSCLIGILRQTSRRAHPSPAAAAAARAYQEKERASAELETLLTDWTAAMSTQRVMELMFC